MSSFIPHNPLLRHSAGWGGRDSTRVFGRGSHAVDLDVAMALKGVNGGGDVRDSCRL